MDINQVTNQPFITERQVNASIEGEKLVVQAQQPQPEQKVEPKENVERVKRENSEQSSDYLKNMAKELQGLADSLGRSVQFKVNEESGDDVILVFHKKTKELIRQIPSEEIIEIKERLSNVFGGIIEEQI